MRKILLIVLILSIISVLDSQEKWELIDNKLTVPAPNNKSSEFVLNKSVVIGSTIYSLNTRGKFSIIKTEDYGKNWDSCVYAPFNDIGASTRFYKLLNHNNSLFVPADNGRLYNSFDGGDTWGFTSFAEKDNHPIQHIKFVNENVGFVGHIYNNILTKTTDGGKTWNPLPNASNIFPPAFAFLNFVPIDENNIIIIIKEGTDLKFFKTEDGGNNWKEFQSELFEETEFVNQDYDQMIYSAPYTFVESGYKSGALGHTRIMRTIDFEKWEPAFISDTLGGGKRIKSFQIYEGVMFGYGEHVLLISMDQGNTWVDLYNKDDDFYNNGNSDGFAYIDNYGYAQSNIKEKDSDGNIWNIRKMFRYKFDLQTTVESIITKLNVYPNPAKTEINIKYDMPINSIEILDLNGKRVFNSNSLNSSFEQIINVDFLNTGTYFIRINDNIYKRIIKE